MADEGSTPSAANDTGANDDTGEQAQMEDEEEDEAVLREMFGGEINGEAKKPEGGEKPKTRTNHDVDVKNVFFVNNVRMVLLKITFDKVPTQKNTAETPYEVLIPFDSIERKQAPDKIREKLMPKTNTILFVNNPVTYSMDLMAKVQYFEEVLRTNEDIRKTVYSFDKPTAFEVNNICYLACGELWKITSPVQKINEDERKDLPFILDYQGIETKYYEHDEQKLITGILSLIDDYNAMQIDSTVHGLPVTYLCRRLEEYLYQILLKKYYQPITYCSTGKKNGINSIGCGKTLICILCELLTTGEIKGGATFSESHIFGKVSKGHHVVIDELHVLTKETEKALTSIITCQYQGLDRMVGPGGKPLATVTFQSNKPPSKLKLPDEIRKRLLWLYAGSEPLRPIPGRGFTSVKKKMVKEGEELHQFLPTLLSWAVECFNEQIPDDEYDRYSEMLGEDHHVAQYWFNLEKFHNKLKEMANKYGIQNIPASISREVDYRIYQHQDPGLGPQSGANQLDSFLSALSQAGMEQYAEWSEFKEKPGIKIYVTGLKNCEKWVRDYAKDFPWSADAQGRFRFLAEKNGLNHSFVNKLKLNAGCEINEESDFEEEPEETNAAQAEETCRVRAEEIYAIEEDFKLVTVIIRNGLEKDIRIDELWKELERRQVLVGRNWESMKQRFLSSIIPNIEKFVGVGISAKNILELRKAAKPPRFLIHDLDEDDQNPIGVHDQEPMTGIRNDGQDAPPSIQKVPQEKYHLSNDVFPPTAEEKIAEEDVESSVSNCNNLLDDLDYENYADADYGDYQYSSEDEDSESGEAAARKGNGNYQSTTCAMEEDLASFPFPSNSLSFTIADKLDPNEMKGGDNYEKDEGNGSFNDKNIAQGFEKEITGQERNEKSQTEEKGELDNGDNAANGEKDPNQIEGENSEKGGQGNIAQVAQKAIGKERNEKSQTEEKEELDNGDNAANGEKDPNKIEGEKYEKGGQGNIAQGAEKGAIDKGRKKDSQTEVRVNAQDQEEFVCLECYPRRVFSTKRGLTSHKSSKKHKTH